MDNTTTTDSLAVMVSQIFCNPGRMVDLQAGETLMREGEPNDRLYYVHSGRLYGYRTDARHEATGTLVAVPGDLVGIKSFFSTDIPSWATITAEDPSRVNYVTLEALHGEHDRTPEQLLMPFLCHTLDSRQHMLYKLMRKEQEVDRINFLGQFSAGVAHELNNALAVIVRGAEWLGDALDHEMHHRASNDYQIFKIGMTRGRQLSSKSVRERTRELQKNLQLSYADAKRIAGMGLTPDELRALQKDLRVRARDLVQLWELGATFNDVRLAAEQAGSVVESMRNLGARSSMLETSVPLLDTFRTAIMICRNASRNVTIHLDFDDDALQVRGSKGELVQVWTNLIKNACDALRANAVDNPQIWIQATATPQQASITVRDNGGGIAPEILAKIFLPNFTTKRDGLNFGLGLGLAIVQRVINGYDGTIDATTVAGGACFTVTLPRVTPATGA